MSLQRTLAIDIASSQVINVIEQDGAIFIESSDQIAIYRGQTIVASVAAPSNSEWTALAEVDALDGIGRWIVATDRSGGLWSISSDGTRAPLNDRLSIKQARWVAAAGSTLAVAGNAAIAVADDGAHMTTYQAGGRFSVGRHRLALATLDGVELWDLARGTRVRFPIQNARSLAFAGERLIVAGSNELFVETPQGLRRLPLRGVKSLAVAKKAWVLTDTRLLLLDGVSLIPVDVDVRDVRRLYSSGDDVWLVAATHVERYGQVREAADRAWFARVEPIFRRSCAPCHLAGGTAGVDLSSPASWSSRRALIRTRVLVERSMPPAGTDITDEDRRTVDAWIRSQ